MSKQSKPALKLFAGKRAYARIRANGLRPDDVKAVFGASGAAKWLAIARLDEAVFGQWMSEAKHSLPVYGTSIGAIKLAAAVQPDAGQRLQSLARAYIDQRYDGRPTADAIVA